MKTKHRRIIALQANVMRKTLKQVKCFKSEHCYNGYGSAETLWQNQVSLNHSIKALSFNKYKLARLLRVVAIDFTDRLRNKLYGNFFSVKTIIVASTNFDFYMRLRIKADDDFIISKAEAVGLSFFHKHKEN